MRVPRFPAQFHDGYLIACEDIKLSRPLEYYGSQRAPLFAEFINYPQTNRALPIRQSDRCDDYVAAWRSHTRGTLLIRKGDVMFRHLC